MNANTANAVITSSIAISIAIGFHSCCETDNERQRQETAREKQYLDAGFVPRRAWGGTTWEKPATEANQR